MFNERRGTSRRRPARSSPTTSSSNVAADALRHRLRECRGVGRGRRAPASSPPRRNVAASARRSASAGYLPASGDWSSSRRVADRPAPSSRRSPRGSPFPASARCCPPFPRRRRRDMLRCFPPDRVPSWPPWSWCIYLAQRVWPVTLRFSSWMSHLLRWPRRRNVARYPFAAVADASATDLEAVRAADGHVPGRAAASPPRSPSSNETAKLPRHDALPPTLKGHRRRRGTPAPRLPPFYQLLRRRRAGPSSPFAEKQARRRAALNDLVRGSWRGDRGLEPARRVVEGFLRLLRAPPSRVPRRRPRHRRGRPALSAAAHRCAVQASVKCWSRDRHRVSA